MTALLASRILEGIKSGDIQPETFRSNVAKSFGMKRKNHGENTEISIFNAACRASNNACTPKTWKNEQFIDFYLCKWRCVREALKLPNIIADIDSGTLRPHMLASMTHQQLDPERWNSLLKKQQEREQNMFHSNVQASTDSYVCRRCRQNKCTYHEMQTRSADEPMTIFISCVNCGNKWRI